MEDVSQADGGAASVSWLHATFVVSGPFREAAGLRRDVRRYLARAGVPDRRIADVVLVLSELVTNALEASADRGVIDVEVTAGPGAIRLDVTNRRGATATARAWPFPPTVDMPPPADARGRGLPLVAALAARMSIDVSDERTHICAEMAR